jgi:predicted metal-dependent HD superfamily phosphohydrolase
VTVLIDAPLWPAHGTLWSHLVSDLSLDELHDFAARAGIARRAFDLDHYDVPEARFAELVALGAVPTDRRELVRRLAAAGLRVAGHARGAAKRAALQARWDALLPGTPTVGSALLDRWYEPHRTYHGPAHLTHVLDSLVVLDPDRTAPRAVALALWFHDAAHDGAAGADEAASAALAGEVLGALGATSTAVGTTEARGTQAAEVAAWVERTEIAEVQRLVLLTTHHDPAPDDHAGALVCDADLAILGSAPDRYTRYTEQVRREYAHVPDEVFGPARAEILERLLDTGPFFRTAVGSERWEAAARRNVSDEIVRLRSHSASR